MVRFFKINHDWIVLHRDELNPSRNANQQFNFLRTIKNPDSKTILDDIARATKRKVASMSGWVVII
jgi:hypothetical protein